MPTFICTGCKSKLSAPDSSLGKKVQCRCGAILRLPSAPQNPIDAKPGDKAQSAKASVTKKTTESWLDQLTANDYAAAMKKPETAGMSQNKKDSRALDAFSNPDAQAISGNRLNYREGSSSASVEDLETLSTTYFAAAGLRSFYLLYSLISLVLNSGAWALRGLVFVLILEILPIGYDLAAGLGLKNRKPWGWWLGAIGFAWAFVRSLLGIRFSISTILGLAQGKLDLSSALNGLLSFGFAVAIATISIWMLRKMFVPRIMSKFHISIAPAAAWVICLVGGIVLAAVHIALIDLLIMKTLLR